MVVGKPDFVRSVTSGFEEADVSGGQLAIYVGVDGLFGGALIMSDPLRDNAVSTLADLRRLGIGETLLLTGDAPVLAAADVGVAMGAKGSTAASESADVVIMLDDLSKAALAVDIGQRTVRIALASIWTGMLLSIGLMVAAVFGYIPAVAGALLQELVDLATILNALRALRGGRPRNTTPARDTEVSVPALR